MVIKPLCETTVPPLSHKGLAMTVNREQIPQELKNIPKWICWKLKSNGEKPTKIPINPKTNKLAKINDLHTCVTFDEAFKFYIAKNTDGVGFVLTPDDPYCIIDLDDCINPNNAAIDPEAQSIIASLKSYAERSQSGRGIHIIVKAKLPKWAGNRNGKFEIYDSKRYFSITGNRINSSNTEIMERQEEVNELCERKFRKQEQGELIPPDKKYTKLSDQEVLDRASKAKNCYNFNLLFVGNWQQARNSRGELYASQSEADEAFCYMLKFWTRDYDQILRLIQRSELWREKWERPDYQHRTIGKALSAASMMYKERRPKVACDNEKENKIFNLTDYGNAERLAYWHGDNIRYVWGANEWYFWNGKYWQIDSNGHIQRLAKDVVRSIHKEIDLFIGLSDEEYKAKRKEIFSHEAKSESNIKQKAMIELARSEPGIAIEPSQLDANQWLLNCNNGTIDLKTGDLFNHSKDNLITKIVPVEYDPKARLDLWDDFLKTATGGNENISSFLQYAVGYSLTGDTSEEKLFFIYGPTATGKSTFIESVRAVFGNYAKTADFETFLSRSFVGGIRNDIAELAGARLVSSVEVDEGKKLAEGLVKTITGGDTIRARFLYKEAFDFIPQFKLWLVANHRPEVSAYDSAMWRRILVVDFNHVIPEEERDPTVKAALRNPEIAGPAILAWAVQGCLRWQEYGLQVPEEIKKSSETYRQEMDMLSDFIKEKCIKQIDVKVTKQMLYKQYKEWCLECGIEPETKIAFGKMLKECHKIKDDSGAQNVSIWVGIGLKAMVNENRAESEKS